jgi:hypothetical protein
MNRHFETPQGHHLVADSEPAYLAADCLADSGGFDAERHWRPAADIPVADPDALLPVANACRFHRDQHLVARDRTRHIELEHLYPAADCVDSGSTHVSSSRLPSFSDREPSSRGECNRKPEAKLRRRPPTE